MKGDNNMIGAIIGDIAGSKYEFNNIRTTNFETISEDCFFTDDTVCTIACMDWLLYAEKRNKQTAVQYLQKWTRRYPNAGYGGRFRNWVFSNDPKPYGSYGNGSAMRISPVAWAAKDVKELMDLVDDFTRITHNHPEGIKGAFVTAVCVYDALQGKSKKAIKEHMLHAYPEIASFDYETLRKTYHFNETCQQSVPQAIYCFLISNDFEDCIKKTISIGGDCDTTAAISCAIAEAFYVDVPLSLIQKARQKLPNEMIGIIDEFQSRFCK